ncbi:MAG TPA: oligosaccharide flippase family protein, partial [Gemmatimonadota bacterium]|nr:oligosaccharide flippase family protein [Gemmatimonadota bacterium]
MGYRDRSSSPGQQTLAGTVRVLGAEALVFPTGVITAAWLTRRLGADGYGVFSLAALIVTWVEWSVVSLFSRSTILTIREAVRWKPLATRILQLHLAFGVLAAAALWLVAPSVAAVLSVPALGGYLRLFAVDVAVFVYAHGHRNIATGRGRFGLRARAVATRWLSRMVLMIVLVGLGLSIRGAILASIGASLLELLMARRYDRPPVLARSEVSSRPFLATAAPLLVAAMALRVVQDADLFTLKALGGSTAEAGFYAAARNLSLAPTVFAAAFAPLILSTLVRLAREGEIDHARELARDALRLTLLLVPFTAAAAGAAGGIVELVFGAEFAPAGPILSRLLFAGAAVTVMAVGGTILIAGGRLDRQAVILVSLVPAAIGGHLWAIPRFGPIGAAWVSTCVMVAGALLTAGAIARMWDIRPPLASVARIALVSLAAGLGARAWPAAGWQLIAQLALIGAAIPPALVAMGEVSRR